MNPFRAFLIAGMALCCALSTEAQTREIIGYYPSWKHQTEKNPLTPAKIPYSKFTIINYAFFFPRPDGTIAGRDSVGDALILRGEESLTALAHNSGVLVLLSIGGWEDSNNFPQVAAHPATRAQFAHSCAERIREFNFDGIDIDWEFPGYADHNGSPADRENFTLLLQTVRDSLDALGRPAGVRFLLTAALPSDRSRAEGMDVREIARILDFVNIMTYDFYGPWDTRANHNAPLYASEGSDSSRSVHGAFMLYHEAYGIAADRINLGVPFYGHTYRDCTALNALHAGSDTAHFPKEGAFYNTIADRMKHFTRRWDDRAKVPYLVSKDWKMIVSYDDEESVAWKARYVVEKGARGLIIWEVTADTMPTGDHPLLDAIVAVFQHSQTRRK